MSTAPTLRLAGRDRPEPLWREVVGARLRHLRRRRALTLAETARRAGISPQYLSEVERGRKDPSSEVLAAISGALGADLVEVTHLASLDLRRQHAPWRSRRPARSGCPPDARQSGGVREATSRSTMPYSTAASGVKIRSRSVSRRSVVQRLAGVLRQHPLRLGPQPDDLVRLEDQVGDGALAARRRLVQQHPRVRQDAPVPGGSGGQQDRRGRAGLADAGGRDRARGRTPSRRRPRRWR